MPSSSPAIAAAIRAMRGESDLAAVRALLDDSGIAIVVALTPSAHPIIAAVAALRGGLTALLNRTICDDPALHAAVAQCIGTPEGRSVLHAWAEVAPAGWGAPYAKAITDALYNERCFTDSAAALIGPCDDSAALISTLTSAEFILRRWGEADPTAPTAWERRVSPTQLQRLRAIIERDPARLAACLPWISAPPNVDERFDGNAITRALNAFAEASPVARAQHAALIDRLIAGAPPESIGALTRLACATGSDAAWRRIRALIEEDPFVAGEVVEIAPWDNVDVHVQTTILKSDDGSNVCRSIAAARGEIDLRPIDLISMECESKPFFAALDPKVWDRLPLQTQKGLLEDMLWEIDAHLAVRSLGPRPSLLSRAHISNELIRAAQRLESDDAATRWALLPVALGALSPVDAHALISGMPTLPPDPGAFFGVASRGDSDDLIASVRPGLRSPADLACAVTIRRCAQSEGRSLRENAEMLATTLHGRTWDDLAPIPVLASMRIDIRTLAASLAHAWARDAMLQTLERIEALPPDVAIPALATLNQWRGFTDDSDDRASALAFALRAHGDVVVDLVATLHDEPLRAALLPLPKERALAQALVALARDDLPMGRDLALAVRKRLWVNASAALLHAPAHHADAVLTAMPANDRAALLSNAERVIPRIAADERCAEDLHTAYRQIAASHPRAALALAALAADDDAMRERGIAVLGATPDIVRSLLPLLSPRIQTALRTQLTANAITVPTTVRNPTDETHRAARRRM